ncbi:hypothetical protein LVJ94_47365 [Pendulispora rubella]|uniref:Uncharacterized protein n=1 Tax=Pendulispora rubella TaxID=2741070 RepID=A0ABZ2L2F0_9BACT
MRFRWALLLGAGAALLTLAAVAAGCEDSLITLAPCGEIPAGGCPRRGDTCADVTCDAVYTCTEGAWTRIATCPTREAGPRFDAGNDDADAAPPSDASWLDVPGSNGGPGCADLEPPDCPLGLAASCPNGCCGCEDLFVCRNRGWEFWGTCPPQAPLWGSLSKSGLSSP